MLIEEHFEELPELLRFFYPKTTLLRLYYCSCRGLPHQPQQLKRFRLIASLRQQKESFTSSSSGDRREAPFFSDSILCSRCEQIALTRSTRLHSIRIANVCIPSSGDYFNWIQRPTLNLPIRTPTGRADDEYACIDSAAEGFPDQCVVVVLPRTFSTMSAIHKDGLNWIKVSIIRDMCIKRGWFYLRRSPWQDLYWWRHNSAFLSFRYQY